MKTDRAYEDIGHIATSLERPEGRRQPSHDTA